MNIPQYEIRLDGGARWCNQIVRSQYFNVNFRPKQFLSAQDAHQDIPPRPGQESFTESRHLP